MVLGFFILLYKVFYVLSEIDCSVLFVENFFFKLRLQLRSFSVLLSEGSQVLEPSPLAILIHASGPTGIHHHSRSLWTVFHWDSAFLLWVKEDAQAMLRHLPRWR